MVYTWVRNLSVHFSDHECILILTRFVTVYRAHRHYKGPTSNVPHYEDAATLGDSQQEKKARVEENESA